jgi:selenoprotein W-related protein
VEDEIRNAYNDADVLAVPGTGGVFDVEVDGKIIFSKHKENRFPEENEIITLLQEAR